MSRYSRQTCLAEVGTEGQARLAAARVLVVGAGGLGSTLLPLLAGAGVGHLRVVDDDEVDESNLHRQTLYRTEDVGRPKATVAAERLASLNTDCRISPLVARLDPALARREIVDADIVVDAADMFAVTYALSDLCAALSTPLITASVQGLTGYVGGFCGGVAPGYRSVFPDLPPTLQSCTTAGVLGPVVATLGALQAQMVLTVLLGLDPSPLGRMVSVDLRRWTLSEFRFEAEGEEEQAPAILAAADVGAQDIVVELRGEAEAPALPFAHATRIPPGEIDEFRPEPGRRVVFVCATGLRAWRAARHVSAAHAVETAILAMP